MIPQPQYYWYLGLENSLLWGCPVHSKILSSILRLHPLKTRSTPPSQGKINTTRQCLMSPVGKIHPKLRTTGLELKKKKKNPPRRFVLRCLGDGWSMGNRLDYITRGKTVFNKQGTNIRGKRLPAKWHGMNQEAREEPNRHVSEELRGE